MNALDAAHRLFAANRAAVVLVRDGRICAQGNGRGLAPLLDLCDRQPSDVAGAWVVDRVVGRAAAAVCIAFGAARVHADLMCEPARALLAAHGVACSADRVVPQILNRDQSGPCPLEAAVQGLDDVPAMVSAARTRLQQLRAF